MSNINKSFKNKAKRGLCMAAGGVTPGFLSSVEPMQMSRAPGMADFSTPTPMLQGQSMAPAGAGMGGGSPGLPPPGGQPVAHSGIQRHLGDQIALGAAHSALSNTEKYQLANPNNQPYSAAGPAPGSSAAASQEERTLGIQKQLLTNLQSQPGMGMAAGGVAETADQLIARMAKQYGGAAAAPAAPAPAPVAAPAPAAAAPAPQGILQSIRNRNAQLKEAAAMANGGVAQGIGDDHMVHGPGPVGKDSVPATLAPGEGVIPAKMVNDYFGGPAKLEQLIESQTGEPTATRHGLRGQLRAAGGYGGDAYTPEQYGAAKAKVDAAIRSTAVGTPQQVLEGTVETAAEQRVNAGVPQRAAPAQPRLDGPSRTAVTTPNVNWTPGDGDTGARSTTPVQDGVRTPGPYRTAAQQQGFEMPRNMPTTVGQQTINPVQPPAPVQPSAPLRETNDQMRARLQSAEGNVVRNRMAEAKNAALNGPRRPAPSAAAPVGEPLDPTLTLPQDAPKATASAPTGRRGIAGVMDWAKDKAGFGPEPAAVPAPAAGATAAPEKYKSNIGKNAARVAGEIKAGNIPGTGRIGTALAGTAAALQFGNHFDAWDEGNGLTNAEKAQLLVRDAGTLAGGVGGAVVGGVGGAILGSEVPIVGNLIGGAVGGVTGGHYGGKWADEGMDYARRGINSANGALGGDPHYFKNTDDILAREAARKTLAGEKTGKIQSAANGVTNTIASGLQAVGLMDKNAPAPYPESERVDKTRAAHDKIMNNKGIGNPLAPITPELKASLVADRKAHETTAAIAAGSALDPRFTASKDQTPIRGLRSGTSTVDATEMQAPDGGGYITNKSGKAMFVAGQKAPERDPNKTYDANGNDMTRTNGMRAQLEQMQKDRFLSEATATNGSYRAGGKTGYAAMQAQDAVNLGNRNAATEELKGKGLMAHYKQLEQQQAASLAMQRYGVQVKQRDDIAGQHKDYLDSQFTNPTDGKPLVAARARFNRDLLHVMSSAGIQHPGELTRKDLLDIQAMSEAVQRKEKNNEGFGGIIERLKGHKPRVGGNPLEQQFGDITPGVFGSRVKAGDGTTSYVSSIQGGGAMPWSDPIDSNIEGVLTRHTQR